MFSRTIGRRDAAVERTGMYLQRVLENISTSRECARAGICIKTGKILISVSVMSAIAITHRGANEINYGQQQLHERIASFLRIGIGFHHRMSKIEQDEITTPHIHAWVI